MFKIFILSILLCFGGVITTYTAFAQANADSLAYKNPLYTNTQNSFYQAIGSQSRLYDGKRYEFYDHAILSNAYYMDITDWRVGSIVYDGYLYEKVDMLYDLFKDQLIIHLYNSFLKISLVSEKVKTFNLLDHHFEYIKNDPANPTSVKTGFYDDLYSGKIKVLAKRQKTLQTTHGFSGSIDSYFTSTSTDYYIFKNGNYYSFGSQGTFLNVLKDKKKDLQQFIRTNKIKYRKNKEQAMAMIAEYYDHLPQ